MAETTLPTALDPAAPSTLLGSSSVTCLVCGSDITGQKAETTCYVCLASNVGYGKKGSQDKTTSLTIAPRKKSSSNGDYSLEELVAFLGFPPGTERKDIPEYAHHYLRARKSPTTQGKNIDELLSHRLDQLQPKKPDSKAKAKASEQTTPSTQKHTEEDEDSTASDTEDTASTRPSLSTKSPSSPRMSAGLPIPTGAGLGINLKPLPTVERQCFYHAAGGCGCTTASTAMRKADAMNRENVAETVERGLMMDDNAKRRLNGLCNSTISDFLYWPNGPSGVLPPKLSYFPQNAFVIRGLSEEQLHWIMLNYGLSPESSLQRSQQKLLLFLSADYLANLM